MSAVEEYWLERKARGYPNDYASPGSFTGKADAAIAELEAALANLEKAHGELLETALIAQGARAEAEAALAEAMAILEDIYDEDECRFDHHGYCQAHGWFGTKDYGGECPDARAKRFLARYDAE